jgi:hypothetical protein
MWHKAGVELERYNKGRRPRRLILIRHGESLVPSSRLLVCALAHCLTLSLHVLDIRQTWTTLSMRESPVRRRRLISITTCMLYHDDRRS